MGIDYTKESDKEFQKLLCHLEKNDLCENIEIGIKSKKKSDFVYSDIPYADNINNKCI